MTYLPHIAVALAVLGLFNVVMRRWSVRRLTLDRLFDPDLEAPPAEVTDAEPTPLRLWLLRAGYDDPNAVRTFIGIGLGGAALGRLAPFLWIASGISARLSYGLSAIPGAVGEIFLPFVYLAPWLLAAMIAALPWLAVRRARRVRVKQTEQDLPIFLELFATLSEAGLGFDAALDRILRSQPADRPLASEFRSFQLEILAGRPRIQSLRRMSDRLDVSSFSVFISAMVQAEQVGSGVAMVLRRQADDLRDRRREGFLAQAMALPVKLVFPLVICFLPGIFVVTLGPVFYQFFQFADGLMRNRGGLP
ncbi:MAG: type II secretion system F family protein [Gemmataceae bacterium]